MNCSLVRTLSVATISLLPWMARAHVTYTGRNLGTHDGSGLTSTSIANQAVTGNYGWADAADGNLGDSHRGRAFRFELTRDASIVLTISANPSATASSIGGLFPGVSIYYGLAAVAPFAPSQTALPASADHDDTEASRAWRASWALANLGPLATTDSTDGSWNSLGDWRIGGDGDLPGDFSQLSQLQYRLSATDADRDGVVTLSGTLAAGQYTVMIGGIDPDNKTSVDAGKAYGMKVDLTVNQVPEPGTWALLLSGGTGLAILGRRRA